MSTKFAMAVLAAQLIPEEMVLNDLEEAIHDYRSAVLDSEKEVAGMRLISVSNILSLKLMQRNKSITEIMDDFDKFESLQKMMKPGGN